MAEPRSFTGRTRQRRTRWTVRAADVVSQGAITIGGIGTIVAVTFVCVVLLAEVLPLFVSGRVEPIGRAASAWGTAEPAAWSIDEYRKVGWALMPDGRLIEFDLGGGAVLRESRPWGEGVEVTAASVSLAGGVRAFGIGGNVGGQAVSVGYRKTQPGGSPVCYVTVGVIGYQTRYLEDADAPPEVVELIVGQRRVLGPGVAERTPVGQLRVQEVEHRFAPPKRLGAFPAVLIDHAVLPGGAVNVVGYCRGAEPAKRLFAFPGSTAMDLDTGGSALRLGARVDLPWEPGTPGNSGAPGDPGAPGDAEDAVDAAQGEPRHLLAEAGMGNVYLAWEDGRTVRIRTQVLREATVAEVLDLAPEPGARLTAVRWVLGERTLMTGDSEGRVRGWFGIASPHRPGDPATPDGRRTVLAKRLSEGGGSAVVALGASPRSRLSVAGFADGRLDVWLMTNENHVASAAIADPAAIRRVAIAPKEDGLVALGPAGLFEFDLAPGFPQVTLASLFLPVWYEGYPAPRQMWQSSSGTDDSEPKLGLMPLVFGTVKATLYSMFFAVPLALLAAIYTSEFLHPRVKARIKPAIEMMASLPSVVLGFVAALFIAPIVERAVPVVLALFLCVPLAFLATAYLWQMLPERSAVAFRRYRFLFILLVLPLGAAAAWGVGPILEDLLFGQRLLRADGLHLLSDGGDLRRWLDGARQEPVWGHPLGGWLFLFLPLSAVLVGLLASRVINPRLRAASEAWTRRQHVLADSAKFLALAAATVLLALLASWLVSGPLDLWRLDARGSFVDTYAQRNALIVGFVMGFAVIPIIYTIAEDALSTVPEHLRAASLGAGATPWQTTVRVIIPTAMSGLFSACMIGLGRAVGETMIVLMAAGNTPVMDWNIFNGFRTLSANIAVELPEADKGGYHYRTLFLAALALFVMTFIVNTIAEAIRQRFRRRAYQL